MDCCLRNQNLCAQEKKKKKKEKPQFIVWIVYDYCSSAFFFGKQHKLEMLKNLSDIAGFLFHIVLIFY